MPEVNKLMPKQTETVPLPDLRIKSIAYRYQPQVLTSCTSTLLVVRSAKGFVATMILPRISQQKQVCLGEKKRQYTVMEKASVKVPFQEYWYKQFKWLVLCTTRMKAFCFYCRLSTSCKIVTFSSKAEEAFTVTGFSN